MDKRIELHNKLKELLGSNNVYYQPPENLKMEYPAIVYCRDNVEKKYANDSGYSFSYSYTITVIDKKPDNDAINKILLLPYSNYSRHYVSEGFNHDVITLYF